MRSLALQALTRDTGNRRVSAQEFLGNQMAEFGCMKKRTAIHGAVRLTWVFAIACGLVLKTNELLADSADDFDISVLPILKAYCFDCHGNGTAEGNLTLDAFTSEAQAAAEPELWWKVLKNVRSQVMPPLGNDKPNAEQIELLADWIKHKAFDIDPADPDPGKLTVRRLNRTEYGNTISDLMGVSFDAALLFPPDDSGFGFDNVGDALSFSPLLMEKYLKAAQSVVDRAVPGETWVLPSQQFSGRDFRDNQRDIVGHGLTSKKPAHVKRTVQVDTDGEYRLDVAVRLNGTFEFDPNRYIVVFRIDGKERSRNEYGWDENKQLTYEFHERWMPGDHELAFELIPIAAEESTDLSESGGSTNSWFDVASVRIEGPQHTTQLVHPANYQHFFTRDEPPLDALQRRDYAKEVLTRFTKRAFRNHPSANTIERLVSIAQQASQQPGATFESGIAQAMIAVLASPRFLFRLETPAADKATNPFAPVDELSLASRLSYFLWSTMPDDDLFQLAEQGNLRKQLPQQIQRMLQDDRTREFVRNFVGQWLRTRDVRQVSVDPIVVLGFQEEYEELLTAFRSRRSRGFNRERTPEEEQARNRFREIRDIVDQFDDELKRSMQRETEMCVEYIAREDRSLLDLLNSDYTFVNEKLAKLYGIPNVSGDNMQRVQLPPDSPRGGVLGHGSMLLITSNPTRTSPVKRGLFVLENILGTPSPPAPPNVPSLESSTSRFGDHEPTLRELLAAHRESALCSSCHSRMDPLGLALENFDALGRWRENEAHEPIDASGILITGESFRDVRELKKILREHHATDFYRCVTQKMLTFAIGRGLDYTDEHAVDLIVNRLQNNDGRFSELINGVIESAPFQKIRTAPVTTAESKRPDKGKQ